ncbi:MAG: hypothetical protein ACE5JX_12420 [Acidobacteriota bacterium]
MKELFLVSFASLVLPSLLAQGRASMEAPVIKSTPDEITIVARFSDLSTGGVYRVGIGCVGKMPPAKIELQKEGAPSSAKLVDFAQGNASSWWRGVDQVQSRGFILQDSLLPGHDEGLMLKVILDRTEADRIGKFYIFVAKKYGSKTWYLEDAAELGKKYW